MKRLILVAVAVGLGAAIRYLPWWASTALIVATPLVAWALFKRFVSSFFLGAFKAKSAVLAGASARVLSIEAAPPYKPEDPDDEAFFEEIEAPHHWVYLEVDVRVPENPGTPMNFWDPSELSLVSENADPDDFEADEPVGELFGVEVLEDGAWVTLEDKVSGSQRLRLHAAAHDGVDRFRLRYYFELLHNAA